MRERSMGGSPGLTTLYLMALLAAGMAHAQETAPPLTIETVDPGTIRVTMGEPACALTSNGAYVSVSAEGFQIDPSPGDPALPCRVLHVAVPPEADLSSIQIRVTSAEERILQDGCALAPCPPAKSLDGPQDVCVWGEGKNIVNGRNMNVYRADAFYPSSCVKSLQPNKMRKWKVVPFVYYPVQYNPVTGQLRLTTRAEISISFAPSKTLDAQAQAALADTAMDDVAQSLIDNYGAMAPSYQSGITPSKKATYSYAIITTEAIRSNASELPMFETMRENAGFNVLTVTESATYIDVDGAGASGGWGGGTGDTAAENLRAWLTANYIDLGIEYVLLIGNPEPESGDVAMKMCYPFYTIAEEGADPNYWDYPTDFYFADLTEDWNADGDEMFGEYDDDTQGSLPEVYVGRIPVYGGDYESLGSILRKTYAYLVTDPNAAWRQRVLLPMVPLDEETPGYPLGEAIRTDFAIPSGWASYRLYAEDYGCAPEMFPCTGDNVKNEWKNGYGLVTWLTHGWPLGAMNIFEVSLCQEVDDTRPSFTFQGSCSNGQPEYSNNLGFSLLQHGAVATVSATRTAWYRPGNDFGDLLGDVPEMAYAYSGHIIAGERAGQALATIQGRDSISGMGWTNALAFNLYGDPALSTSEYAGGALLQCGEGTIRSGCPPGANAASRTFEVWRLGTGTLTYSITDSATWLSVTPSSSSTAGEHDTITVNFTTSALPQGLYQAAITVTAPGSAAGPVTIPVELEVFWPLDEAVNQPAWAWTTAGAGPWYGQRTITHDGDAAGQSPVLGEGQAASFSTTLAGPGLLTFWWRVSCANDSLFGEGLHFTMDGVVKERIRGERDWTQISLEIPEGQHLVLWEYVKDSNGVTAGSDCGWVDQIEFNAYTAPFVAISPIRLQPGCLPGENAATQTFEIWNAGQGTLNYTLQPRDTWLSVEPTSGSSAGEHDVITVTYATAGLSAKALHNSAIDISAPGAVHAAATFTVSLSVSSTYISLPEALDADGLTWEGEGALYWVGQSLDSHDGLDAAIAGAGSLQGGQTSVLKATVSGPGPLSFWWAAETAAGLDTFSFMIDGVVQGSTHTGDLTWEKVSTYLPLGTHELRWELVCRHDSIPAPKLWVDEVSYLREWPLIARTPSTLTPACGPGQDATSDTFEVWNGGTSTLNYTITDDADWLSCEPTSGSSAGEHDTITVTYDTSALAVGQHTAEIHISAAGVLAIPRDIQVTVGVGDKTVVAIPASKDITIYEDATGSLSNGAGTSFAVGKHEGLCRRALLAFDIEGTVPAGAVIGEVSLDLNAGAPTDDPVPISLFKASKNWGEGASNATDSLVGAAAQAPDATWLHCQYDSSFWANAGGDYLRDARAARSITTAGSYTWGPTSAMRDDVQDWLDDAKNNFGWFLIADEDNVTAAKRFSSGENSRTYLWPHLNITYYEAPEPDTTVPDLAGLAQAEAEAAIVAAGLVVGTVTHQRSETVPAGSVISQDPAAGTLVIAGADVNYVVSDGVPLRTVPDVCGMTEAAATTELTTLLFTIGTRTEAYTTVKAGNVARQSPAASSQHPLFTPVDLVISKGPGPVEVPDLVGMMRLRVEAALASSWLELGRVTQRNSDSVPPGIVLAQSPAAGTSANTGSVVNVTVSIGPTTVFVPDLVGMTQPEAEAALASGDLVLGEVRRQCSESAPANEVIAQTPAAGTSIRHDSPVDLVVSDGPELTSVPDMAGLTEEQAQEALDAVGLALGTVSRESSTQATGLVIGQALAAGSSVPRGTFVDITISKGLAGDVNEDGSVNALDVQLTINAALALDIGGQNADLNGDGSVNALDVQLVINAALGLG